MTVVTLLTDFGLDDTYVGQMKGAILTVAPTATLVDLSHAVPRQDVLAGAFLLWSAVEALPVATIHLAVVDPGVGSKRRPIVIQSRRGDIFVGPDIGLLQPAVDRLGGAVLTVEATQPGYWRPAVSATFHGRDLFGPIVGHLVSGVALGCLGPSIDDAARYVLPQPHGLVGEILHVDTYGNLITNLPAASLPEGCEVHIGTYRVATATHYAAVPSSALLALIGSAGLVEISARDASAAAITGAVRGTRVQLVPP